MTADTFDARIEELRQRTGAAHGHLTGQVEVNQVYAHYQHERPELHHPRGGGPFYLRNPLFDGYRRWLERIGRGMLEDGGQRGMRDAMEDLADAVSVEAPVEFADLRRSGHPTVQLGERVIYDRPPVQHRLERWELRAKARLRHLPPELIGYIWWKVMHHTEPPPHLRGRRR